MRPITPPPHNYPDSLSKYCYGLKGQDRLYCEKIVRGINPKAPVTLTELRISDLFDGCYSFSSSEAYQSLPQSVYSGTWVEYGWWWHSLLDWTPGWWNRQGTDHIYFRDVIAFALGVELSSMGADNNLVGYVAGAFATKASAPGEGFYRFIGSRQSVFMRVNNALYGSISGLDNDKNPLPFDFAKNGRNFNPMQDENDYSIQLRFGGSGKWGEKILSHSGFTVEQLQSWEWGNPTNISPKAFMDALRAGNKGNCDHCLLYFSSQLTDEMTPTLDPSSGLLIYPIEVVLSQNQMHTLCNNNSCVAPK